MTNETGSHDPGTQLTAREHDVCVLVCKGLTNKEVARELGIGARTVEDHRLNLMKKYGVDNVVLLVRKVYRLDEVQA